MALILGGAFIGVAWGAAGGTELTRTTIVEILMLLAGSATIAAAIVWGTRERLHGATSLWMFALLAGLTALSVLWSVVPELTYLEASRTLTYLVVFGAAIGAARLAPRAAPALLKAILLGALAPVAYALATRIWPASLAEHDLSNRIGGPFQYWNAVGTVAAIAIPVALWLGSRRGGAMAGRVLAYPAVALAVLAILLTQSRGSLAAAVLGVGLWFAIVPLRLRSLPVLLIPTALATAVGAWALSKDPFSKSRVPLAAREAVAGDFGMLMLLLVALTLLAGVGVNLGAARGLVPPRLHRRIGVAALAVACLLPFVVFTSVAVSDRGLSGTIDDRVSALTSETEVAPSEGGDRVFATSSTRGKYWREAGKVFEAREWAGVGAGAYAVARLRHRTDASVTRHAHGFVAQTLADLGIVGVALTTLLLLAWLAAALHTLSLYPRRLDRFRRAPAALPRRDWSSERIALAALAIVPLVFGLQSLLDWTWFIPGPMALTLVASGFVAGRGPLAPRGEPPRAPPLERPRDARRALAAAGVVLTGLLLCWAVWQPEASDRAKNEALALSEERDFANALEKARDAADMNPLSPDPYHVRASILTAAGRTGGAQRSLEDAVLKFPGDPETWYRLAAFQLGTLDRPEQALETLRGALYLDPHSRFSRQLFLEASARQRELEAAGAATKRREQ
jgi:tetratricopeptide (TPR) repeat protein